MCDVEPVDRRSFLVSAAAATAGLAVGWRSELPRREADSAAPAESAPAPPSTPAARALDDPSVEHEMVSFRSGADVLHGYLARPKAAGRHRAVLVLHGEVGVLEGPRETAAQLAQEGFVALAVKRFDRWPELTLQDVAASDRTDMRYLSASFNDQEVQDAQAAIDDLASRPFVAPGGIGVVGFCGGGYQALLLSTRSKDVRAVVAFYAPPQMSAQFSNPQDPRPSLLDRVQEIRVPVQGHYGADDPVVSTAAAREFERALQENGTPACFFVYAGATHGFYNPTRPQYHAEAAALAKSRMIEFLKQELR
jgi:carboxymethylenebutenolidase